jgi:hypothetical protein
VRELERAEQMTAQLLAERQDLEERLAKLESKREVQVSVSEPPYSRRRSAREYVAPAGGLAATIAIVAGLLKPVLDQRAELAQLALKVDQQKAVLDAQARQAEKWRAYAEETREAHECRWRQAASALAHLDYGLGDTDFSDVRWSNGDKGMGWKRTGSPAFRTIVTCKPFPAPPENQ